MKDCHLTHLNEMVVGGERSSLMFFISYSDSRNGSDMRSSVDSSTAELSEEQSNVLNNSTD